MHISVEKALEALSQREGSTFCEVFRHGSMSLELYAPVERDLQKPHEQDEVYVILSGQGVFQNGERTHPFKAGDFLFVPAGVEHRFLTFSPDFKTWVIFYGPKGGETQEESETKA